MQIGHKARIGAATIFALCLCSSALRAAPRAEALELDDKERATVSKETVKSKQRGEGTNSKDKDKGCGNVDIGNSNDNKGTSRIAERNKTVIVTGNVYNTANCKR